MMIECRVLKLRDESLSGDLFSDYESVMCVFNKIDVFQQCFFEDGKEVVDVQVGEEFYLVNMDFKTFKERYIGHDFGIKFS